MSRKFYTDCSALLPVYSRIISLRSPEQFSLRLIFQNCLFNWNVTGGSRGRKSSLSSVHLVNVTINSTCVQRNFHYWSLREKACFIFVMIIYWPSTPLGIKRCKHEPSFPMQYRSIDRDDYQRAILRGIVREYSENCVLQIQAFCFYNEIPPSDF